MGVSGLLPMFRGSAQTLGAGGASDKHIEFCMGRVALLLHYKVKPLLVFDGGALPAKAAQEASRRGKREHAKAMASQKAREDSQEEARKWYAKWCARSWRSSSSTPAALGRPRRLPRGALRGGFAARAARAVRRRS
ncbi:5'-3' exodeoxyribonuclease [Aureococcus anophagefferens]|nr:5'-3' exodeoxyribonuclease [Aureococcus anophagefferens]